ncbi:MAG: response regulator [Stackebrandtia sp.]
MKLFLVDDHPVVRAGLAALIAGEPDMDIVGEAAAGREALEGVRDTSPDVVLMDLQLEEGPDGVETTRAICALPRPPRVLVLTTYDSNADIVRAVDAGATGYILKACPPEELFAAVRAAGRGESVLSPAAAGALMRRMRDPGRSLTARETEILQLLARGAGNRQIAKQLFVTEATVKTHLVHIFQKLGVESRTAAVSAAVEQRLIRL